MKGCWRRRRASSPRAMARPFGLRASTCDTVSRLCVRPVCCWFAFPLVPALGSTSSAADRSALFASFAATTAGSDFPRSFIIGFRFSLPDADQERLLWPNAGSPKFRHDPFVRDVLYDPGRAGMASLSGHVRVAFDQLHGLRSCDVPITGLNHTPHATAVYASWPASPSAHATLASRLPAGHYLGRTYTD